MKILSSVLILGIFPPFFNFHFFQNALWRGADAWLAPFPGGAHGNMQSFLNV
jgi:hypothetical protein